MTPVDAALAAAARGWHVFPLVPGGKTPVIRAWEERATTDPRLIRRWWADRRRNVGIAVGRSGLLVVDLDDGRGEHPPERFAGARHGADVLALLAAEAGAPVPLDTHTVATPRGRHLYFRAPAGVELRNTAGRVGWRVDSRGRGGYVVGAGSRRPEGDYRVVHRAPVADLPAWLAAALAPPPVEPAPPMRLSRRRATAYLRAIVEGEAHAVASARTGSRHDALFRAAWTLGRLVGAGELAEGEAWHVLLDASARHVGVDGCTAREVERTIRDGIAYGRRRPRWISADRRAG
ncbi:bifunctional DNA primase/polymerase [Saccharothrix obliqua]|uniref:bifunctional DNA primase/polymerase n=1 Tax=Saccharothrix obliqua TaxID=2861747 RepID=UPI001C5F3131|nr:bifunctional DNA primase/polymerase [Saccharothrix obliqua]MBW4717810.1 bifunctional DNA primase/polymerase [Saccharothrix obliqua]